MVTASVMIPMNTESAAAGRRRVEKLVIPPTSIETDFMNMAAKVFAQHSDPCAKAVEEAKMLWLAWRGDEKYVEVYLGDQVGRQSAWRFYEYHELPEMIRHYRHVEVRPMYPPFADHVLAFLVVLLQQEVETRGRAKIYSRSSDPRVLGFVETEIDDAAIYDRVKEGAEVIADWSRKPGDVLKTRSISLSPEHFSFFDYVKAGDKTPLNARGFIYVFKKQDRAAAKRKHRQSAVRWIMSG
jgi:hypothetical protein